ncbi:hypothetical protein BDN71DRAFT_1503341 [Pleurotus eryngii]|uniref:Secreted protein n=1 Tax=Pleurotus eryngii TaxID=5323 RepID=A0A9P6DBT2_PLEER|nr:hypothetical protein BDN71DRAFT_1503341 [Pleurotus eryngii]
MRFLAFFVYYVFALAQANADTRAEALARDSDLAEFTPRVTSPGVGTGSALANCSVSASDAYTKPVPRSDEKATLPSDPGHSKQQQERGSFLALTAPF